MENRESAAQIETAAARWVILADRAPLDPAQQAELDAWLAGDSRRRGAYVRAAAAWSELDRLSVLAHGAAGADAASRRRLPSRRALVGGSLAAGLAGALFWSAPRLFTPRYRTVVGEVRRVPLADGSLAAINTDSEIEVALQPQQRTISLKRGEAWFQVAKDAHRPFVVDSGPVRVRAVGTAFSVRRRAGGSDVLVTEGVVQVWSSDAPSERRQVVAGERIFVADAGGATRPVEAPLEIDRRLAWRDGQVVLDGDRLVDAAEEFNRYNTTKILIADPRLGQQRLVGWFRANDPESFARAAAATFDARVVSRPGEILLTDSREKNSPAPDGS